MKRIAISTVILILLATSTQLHAEGFGHALGLQPFAIPLTTGNSGNAGFGWQIDYEFRWNEAWGLFAGYLQAEYEDELTYVTGNYWMPFRTEYEDVTIGGPVFGMRYRVPTSSGSDRGWRMLIGGTIGIWNKEDKDQATGALVNEEDVVAIYATVGPSYRWNFVELGFGLDGGGITGEDAGGFLALFARLAVVF